MSLFAADLFFVGAPSLPVNSTWIEFATTFAGARVSLDLTLMALFGGYFDALGALFCGAITVLREAFSLVFWILIIRAILSWVSQGYNPVAAVFEQLTEPMLRPIRKVIPPLGGLDLSILVLIIAMQFLQILMMDLFR